MCEGIELAILLSSARGETIETSPNDPRITDALAMGLAMHKHRDRHRNQGYRADLLEKYKQESREELAVELAVYDILASYFPHCTVKWHTNGGPYDITITWPSGFVAYFDVKSTQDRDDVTITQQASEQVAIETGTWRDDKGLEDTIYIVMTRLSGLATFYGSFLPAEETWVQSDYGTSRYIRRRNVTSWI